MLKLIKNALGIADEIIDELSDATEDVEEKIERIGDIINEDPNSLKKNDSVPQENSKELQEEPCTEENKDLTPDKEPNVEQEINNYAEIGDEQTILLLREEIAKLKEDIAKLEALKRTEARILAEIGDFCALFPDVPVEELPDEVWESVKKGAPLAASFALYEKKMAAEAKRIAQINARNAALSPGAAGVDTAGEYFTPDEVRRMSRTEVHANYSKIKESMKKWMQK